MNSSDTQPYSLIPGRTLQNPFTAVTEFLSGSAYQNHPLQPKLRQTLDTIRQSITEFGPYSLSISFNGGKDCTLLLFLLEAILQEYHLKNPNKPKRPTKCLYITTIDSFTQVDEFVDYCSNLWQLDVVRILGNMKDGLQVFLDSSRITKAIFIGTRIGDPFSDTMKVFQPTDDDWPSVMRIHSILDWTYEEIWTAIDVLGIPYCPLYDQGYTSLGSTVNTHPNPLLLNSKRECGFDPAYLLKDGFAERCGRS